MGYSVSPARAKSESERERERESRERERDSSVCSVCRSRVRCQGQCGSCEVSGGHEFRLAPGPQTELPN
jgi:hypothetical protein